MVRTAKEPRRLYAAKTSFSVDHVYLKKGDLVDDGDPIYRKHGHMFEEPRTRQYGDAPKRRTVEPPVEQATAAPGEQRDHPHPHR